METVVIDRLLWSIIPPRKKCLNSFCLPYGMFPWHQYISRRKHGVYLWLTPFKIPRHVKYQLKLNLF